MRDTITFPLRYAILPALFLPAPLTLPAQPLRFRGQMITAESFESASVFDVNNDKQPDIVSGAYWYEGPGFLKRRFIG